MLQRLKGSWSWRLAVALPGLLAGPLTAQSGEDRVSDLRPGAYVRARIGADRAVTGQFIPVGDGRVGIRTEIGGTDTLRLREIGELAVRGRHTKTGAILGGVAGAAFGAFVGYVAYALCEVDSCRDGETFLIAIPAFGVGGALVGAAIGTAFPKWKKVYP